LDSILTSPLSFPPLECADRRHRRTLTPVGDWLLTSSPFLSPFPFARFQKKENTRAGFGRRVFLRLSLPFSPSFFSVWGVHWRNNCLWARRHSTAQWLIHSTKRFPPFSSFPLFFPPSPQHRTESNVRALLSGFLRQAGKSAFFFFFFFPPALHVAHGAAGRHTAGSVFIGLCVAAALGLMRLLSPPSFFSFLFRCTVCVIPCSRVTFRHS